ncbi:MAG TPA: class I SAM-dependent methyltransferase [Methylovirgula sp.]|nr:class I SAM-dependent methyltransferase [Methylovirgula sp.]
MPRALARSESSPRGASLDNRIVERAYARWAPVYDLAFDAALQPGRKHAAAAASRHGGLVLDVGVGTGLELPMFAKTTRVVGVDLSEPMLRRAARRVEQGLDHVAGLGVMDACHLAFADATFDVIIAPYVLTSLPKPEESLDEWVRVLKPGGEIILVNHLGAGSGPIAWVEAQLAKNSATIGWRPEFPWAVLADWLAGKADLQLSERRALPPFGLFTLIRITKRAADGSDATR